jgi:hypothetical protein
VFLPPVLEFGEGQKAGRGRELLDHCAALSHEGATGIVKQRMDEMEHVGSGAS